MNSVQRLRAEIRLDDPQPAIADAQEQAREGDPEWRRWLQEYERQEALIVRLEVWLEYESDGPHVLHVHNRGVWVEKHVDPPKLEAQLAEIVGKDFPLFARQLNEDGFECDEAELAEMYVHIELDERLREELRRPGGDGRVRGLPAAEAGLSRAHD